MRPWSALSSTGVDMHGEAVLQRNSFGEWTPEMKALHHSSWEGVWVSTVASDIGPVEA